MYTNPTHDTRYTLHLMALLQPYTHDQEAVLNVSFVQSEDEISQLSWNVVLAI